ncbi:MAG: ATP-binding cassette domain-containing protein [Blautia sp.]|nr:ATP-binding cassette domain-containing protein [Blautia sp.]
MNRMDAIRIEKAGKCIKNNWIYKDISVAFEQGKIHGLIGRNGAGKTMLLKSICGLTRVTIGEIWVNGCLLGNETDIPDSVGAIIEIPGFLPNLSGFANLKYLAGLKKRIGEKRIKECMEMVGLQAENRKHVGKYSLGMRQRLGIAQAIMEKPDIIILDEPMNGLDNDGVEDVRKILLGLKKEGKTILLASHHKEDIDMLCDKVYRMEKGKLYMEQENL